MAANTDDIIEVLTIRKTDKQMVRQMDGGINRQIERQTDRQTDRRIERYTDRLTDKHTEEQTNRQTEGWKGVEERWVVVWRSISLLLVLSRININQAVMPAN